MRSGRLPGVACFIANILKCRPPNNRDPKPDESSQQCRGYLERQIELVQPKNHRCCRAHCRAACCSIPIHPVGRLRGNRTHRRDDAATHVVTYHPAYLLRSPSQKRKSWDDLCLARRIAMRRRRA